MLHPLLLNPFVMIGIDNSYQELVSPYFFFVETISGTERKLEFRTMLKSTFIMKFFLILTMWEKF